MITIIICIYCFFYLLLKYTNYLCDHRSRAMSYYANQYAENDLAKVAIPKSLLAQLVANGLLHGNECLCLNHTAKHVIWQALLNNSVNWEN